MTPQLGIVNSYNYWLEVIQPNWLNFSQRPSARKAFNLAASLWHVIEWIVQDKRHEHFGCSLKAVREYFIENCPDLAAMHDIATKGKHYTVSKWPNRPHERSMRSSMHLHGETQYGTRV